MEKKLTLKWLIIKLAGVLFAAYSAYNVFIMIRDGKRGLPAEAIVISAFVALLFGVLAVFAWTSGAKNIRFIMVRKAMFIISVLAVIALKLRMAASYISYIDLSQPQTVLYGSTYFLTLAAMLILVAYYAFILKDLMMYPVLSILLPAIAGALFLSCLVFASLSLYSRLAISQAFPQPDITLPSSSGGMGRNGRKDFGSSTGASRSRRIPPPSQGTAVTMLISLKVSQ